ncbi:hypothetical protein [uncultured Draconibacterium sp.]|uniref:hypothetical protein n=1 Tax=uncultured Draconibacterium sp. TaxID=1573823 RepID=UPI002AA8F387|nr:hypothetical protein [uncultured Draconibacterium sp.]
MNLSEKSIKHIGLVVPFTCCPIGEPVSECPFIPFWKNNSRKDNEELIEKLPEEELEKLQTFHDKCLRKKIEQARRNPDDEKSNEVNLKEYFKY